MKRKRTKEKTKNWMERYNTENLTPSKDPLRGRHHEMIIIDAPPSYNKLYIGFDNGISGTVGMIFNNQTWFFLPPTKLEQNYTKKKGNITRIILPELVSIISGLLIKINPESIMCLIERPMVNPKRFQASTSALRALETQLNTVELLQIPYQYEDSKAWQKELLPKGVKGDVALKEASKNIGCRLFPQHAELIKKHKDADGILMAEYCRRKF